VFKRIFSYFNLSLVLGVGLVAMNASSLLASESNKVQEKSQEIAASRLRNEQPDSAPIADGTYLYGESTRPEQIGQEYLVFKVNDGNVTGAIYYPRSEFSCFTGTVENQAIELSIIDSYSGETYAYPIEIQDQSLVAANGGSASRSQVALAGYQKLDRLSENDRRMLQTCQR
jgi:hypothetical protein